MKKWLIFAASCLGLAALCLIIWYIFPVVAIADVRPFAGVWLRLALVMLAVTLFCGFHAYCYYRKRSASAALAGAIAAQAAAEPDSDAKQLAEKMADAIQTLRKSHKTKGDFLYELPWYIIIGPPGAGKTTALLNSGLKFPLLSGKERRPVSGAGGTRYCDWWFTEDAVLIDTAGRYTTQDSDASTDRRSWQVFLGLLKKHRPLQPINGVLVAISLADIVNLPDDEIGRHCAAIRKRLDELHQTLNIAYPVYVVFTKADLVPGFSEYFANLGEQRRKMVWGTTFRVKNKSENPVGEAGDEFDLLVDRLTQEMPDRLQEEGDPVGRVKIYGFPSQMGALRKPVVDFLDQVFEPTRYQTSIPLRGFYFTSGTQEGTPIDRLLGAMAGMSARQAGAAPALSGRAKSYFLGDLLTKVIFGEAGWVSANKTETRRKHMLRYLGYGGAAVACLAGLGLFAISYEINNELIRVTETGLVQYRSDAKDYLAQDVISSDDFTEPMGALTELRQLTAGYGNRDVAPQLGATFGLSQKERLTSSTTAAYHVALDRMLRPRLVLHMEKKLEANLNDPLVIYEALKVYLMLGKEDNVPVDRDYVLGYLGNEWNNTEGKANAKAREEFLGHAAAMLDLNTGGGVPIALNGSLVEEAQKILARLSLADRAYALLKSNAESSDGVDWNVGEHGGPDVETVFETTDGSDLKALHIPRFFTYDGFHRLFLDKLGEYAGQLDNESWVLGPIAQQSLVKSQLATLRDNLIDKYSADFIKAWTAALAQLRMKRLAFDKSDYATLGAITGGASPLRQLIEAVATETKLTAEPPAPAASTAAGNAAAVGTTAFNVIKDRVESNLTGPARTAMEIANKSQIRAGGASKPGSSVQPGLAVEENFRRFAEFAGGEAGQRPIDLLLLNLTGIYQNLLLAKNDPANAASAMQSVEQQVSALRSQNASRVPPPFDKMILDAANEFESSATNTSITDLTAQLRNEVTQQCQETIKNRYPFAAKSRNEVPWSEFDKLFKPGGVIDKFYMAKLDVLVDHSSEEWKWSNKTPIGRQLSSATLKQFQNAAKIRDAFYASGAIPNILLTVTPVTLNPNATGGEFEINGQILQHIPGMNSPKDFQWPGTSTTASGTASVKILPETQGVKNWVGASGAWALYRLFDLGSATPNGDRLTIRYVIGGRDVSYQVKVASPLNPFTLPALRLFSCPQNF